MSEADHVPIVALTKSVQNRHEFGPEYDVVFEDDTGIAAASSDLVQCLQMTEVAAVLTWERLLPMPTQEGGEIEMDALLGRHGLPIESGHPYQFDAERGGLFAHVPQPLRRTIKVDDEEADAQGHAPDQGTGGPA